MDLFSDFKGIEPGKAMLECYRALEDLHSAGNSNPLQRVGFTVPVIPTPFKGKDFTVPVIPTLFKGKDFTVPVIPTPFKGRGSLCCSFQPPSKEGIRCAGISNPRQRRWGSGGWGSSKNILMFKFSNNFGTSRH